MYESGSQQNIEYKIGSNKECLEGINCLSPEIQLVKNRKSFVVNLCKGKNVLHVGCVGSGSVQEKLKAESHLHFRIAQAAKSVIGLDINKKGIEILTRWGFENCFVLDVEKEVIHTELIKNIDVIVIPEVMEHLSNPGKFLANLKRLNFGGDILISVPNAFSYRVFSYIKSNNVEFVHPDHNCYFSPTTLKNLLKKHGFSTIQQTLYYWPSDDGFGKEFETVLENHPYVAEGIISVARDSRFVERKDSNNSAHGLSGEELFQLGLYDEAEEHFKEDLRLNPNDAEAHNNLGVIAFMRNDTRNAIEYITDALKIDPFNRDAIFNLTDILRTLDIMHESVPFLERALQRYPDDEQLKIVFKEAKRLSDESEKRAARKVLPWKVYYSPGIAHHGENMRKMLNLNHYVPSIHINDPVWFFGLYFDQDYFQVLVHQGKKIINWRGSDALKLKSAPARIRLIKNIDALHVCQSHRQQAVLTEFGLKSIVRPMINEDVDNIAVTPFPKDRTRILIFWKRGIDDFIRAELFFEIALKSPDVEFHIVGDEDPDRFTGAGKENLIYHGFLYEQELDDLMDQCKGTLRPWISDGTPNIQTKMILKGRYAAHSCRFEKVALCKNVDNYVAWVEWLKGVKAPNLEARDWWLNHLNIFDFLEVDFRPED